MSVQRQREREKRDACVRERNKRNDKKWERKPKRGVRSLYIVKEKRRVFVVYSGEGSVLVVSSGERREVCSV